MASPLLKFRAQFVRDNYANTCKIGEKLLWRKFGVTGAYAVDRAIMLAIKENIDLLLADYRGATKNTLYSLANALDVYSTINWLMIGFPIQEVSKLIQRGGGLSDNLFRFCLLRLMPHFCVMSSYRNDMMSLAINENRKEKILFMTGAAHSKHIIDRLCGNVKITNPFKEINERRVLLKDPTAYNMVGDKVAELNNEDIEFMRGKFGEEVVRLMSLDNHELNEALLNKIQAIAEIPERELNQLRKDYNRKTTSKTFSKRIYS
eukprot:80631_1